MTTRQYVSLAALAGLLSVPGTGSANCCMLSSRAETCDGKMEQTFTLAGRCWKAKCSGRGETPLAFVLSIDRCQFDPDTLELHANATSGACTTLQIVEEIADVNSIKTECDGLAGVQKLQIKALDKHPADKAAVVRCASGGDCCGEAICDSGIRCCLPVDARCAEGHECCSGACSSEKGVCLPPL